MSDDVREALRAAIKREGHEPERFRETLVARADHALSYLIWACSDEMHQLDDASVQELARLKARAQAIVRKATIRPAREPSIYRVK